MRLRKAQGTHGGAFGLDRCRAARHKPSSNQCGSRRRAKRSAVAPHQCAPKQCRRRRRPAHERSSQELCYPVGERAAHDQQRALRPSQTTHGGTDKSGTLAASSLPSRIGFKMYPTALPCKRSCGSCTRSPRPWCTEQGGRWLVERDEVNMFRADTPNDYRAHKGASRRSVSLTVPRRPVPLQCARKRDHEGQVLHNGPLG